MNKKTKENNSKKKITSKQVFALAGVVFLVLMYIIALIVSIMDNSASGGMFAMCMFCTVVIPMLIWVYTWMYGRLTDKKTFADFDTDDKTDGKTK